MRFLIHTGLLLVFAAGIAPAQGPREAVNDRTPQIRPSDGTLFNRLVSPYKPQEVSPVNFQNSQRIFDLMRAGQLYLSLDDAIALALENNLDIELERFLPKIADTDLVRAHGGGLLRGLSLLVNEPPPGIGGPNGPLLTTLTSGSTPRPSSTRIFRYRADKPTAERSICDWGDSDVERAGHPSIRSNLVWSGERAAFDNARKQYRPERF